MNDFSIDKRVVMTLDAGGTNFVFSALQFGKIVVPPYSMPSHADDFSACLDQIVTGFRYVQKRCPLRPCAISFAFPGPADYVRGIIGDLPNFPSFRGGVALGPYLNEMFHLPVFINNDGALFALGEAKQGSLPMVNTWLKDSGSQKTYKNLLGITLGTGFGGGAVVDGHLSLGDNGIGGNLWCFRNKKYPQFIAEKSVSIRAIQGIYQERSHDCRTLSPKEIADIAHGVASGDQQAAVESFSELGEMAGDTIVMADTIVDGLVVVGGGLANSFDLIFPSLVKEMNSQLQMIDGEFIRRSPVQVYNLDDKEELNDFLKDQIVEIRVPCSDRVVNYDSFKRVGVIRSRLGASAAISIGAYIFALHKLDQYET